ncbi:hypothetical protein AMST5_01304 [freshwater sediment metagenome]|uniref:Uncharacterized protein n=1 Tax=freshwater sediment metagenome TaxID=556182 RepID=A0AA48RDJ7_9ZZZZ
MIVSSRSRKKHDFSSVINAFFARSALMVFTFAAASPAAASGGLAIWGWNFYGQLGNGGFTNSSVPIEAVTSGVLAGKTITRIAGGGAHTCVVTSDDGVYCWGANFNGQLGNGVIGGFSSLPTTVNISGALAGKTVSQITAGGNSTCALASGRAYCWGWGGAGELGNGGYADSSVPVAVTTSGVLAGKTVTQIAGGYHHNCAVTSDGGAYCWGFNSYGQLGNGGNSISNVPVAVTTNGVLAGKTVSQIEGGEGHTCAVTSDGGAYCWGDGGGVSSATAEPQIQTCLSP